MKIIECAKQIAGRLSGVLANVEFRINRIGDCLRDNMILIFAGALVATIAAVAVTWIALRARHDEIGQLIARSF